MSVDISVDVDEHVERLVTCAHAVREDGHRQQVSREVKGTRHRRAKWAQPLGSHVREEVCARSRRLRAPRGQQGGNRHRRSRHKVRKLDCVLLKKVQNEEVDNDVIKVVGVSSDSEVIPCIPPSDSPAPVVSLTDSGNMCGPQRFISQLEKGLCYTSRAQSTRGAKRYAAAAKGFSSRDEEQRHARTRKASGARLCGWSAAVDRAAWLGPVRG